MDLRIFALNVGYWYDACMKAKKTNKRLVRAMQENAIGIGELAIAAGVHRSTIHKAVLGLGISNATKRKVCAILQRMPESCGFVPDAPLNLHDVM